MTPMATYMGFIKWTDQGIKNAKDAHAEAA